MKRNYKTPTEAPEQSTVDTSADNARYRYTDDALVDEEDEEEEEEMVVLDPDHVSW